MQETRIISADSRRRSCACCCLPLYDHCQRIMRHMNTMICRVRRSVHQMLL